MVETSVVSKVLNKIVGYLTFQVNLGFQEF